MHRPAETGARAGRDCDEAWFPLRNGKQAGLDSRPETICAVANGSPKRLGLEVVALFYQHRSPGVSDRGRRRCGGGVDPSREGEAFRLVRARGANRPSRACGAVGHALQNEYSLWTRGPKANVILEACEELGIGFVSYRPINERFPIDAMSKDTRLGEGGRRAPAAIRAGGDDQAPPA
jgi:aryl-alcohol dehydrogenase-like predicted oxidoreductase